MSGRIAMAGSADDRDWMDFEAWCRRRRLRSLPAHPWAVAAFVRWCEARHSHASIVRRMKAIARRHLLAGLPAIERHPLVLRTLRVVERHEQTRGQRAALFPEPTGGLAPAAPKAAKAPARSRRGGLAATPKLVSRRPSPG
jgi:ferric-dicitrate binding protein FerR (iron transport regulator)